MTDSIFKLGAGALLKSRSVSSDLGTAQSSTDHAVAASAHDRPASNMATPSLSIHANHSSAEDDNSSSEGSSSGTDTKLLHQAAKQTEKVQEGTARKLATTPNELLSPRAMQDLSASAPDLNPVVMDKMIISDVDKERKKFSTASKASSTPDMSRDYERFDTKPNGRPEPPSSRSGEFQLEISEDESSAVSIKPSTNSAEATHGYIADPAGRASVDMGGIGSVRLRIQGVVEHIAFRLVTVLLILVDFTLVVVDLSISNCVSSNNALEIVSHVIITFFLLEVFLRIFAKGKSFFIVILDVIDMVVVVISFVIDMVFLALSPSSCEEKEDDRTAYARLIVIGRVVRIIRIVRIIYIAYTQRRHVSAATRQLVSQNKRRYQKDGFDLDLCYITERVIAMSFPSKGLMAVYRNPVEEVARFFNTKHKDHYRIYNLCSERDYDEDLFLNNVERIYIDDHNVPKVREMLSFCDNAWEWMSSDPSNVIAIHCKGGKGRTGTMICVWLLECGLFECSKSSLEYFGDRRTDLSKGETFQGVETPSQSRYVGYFEKLKTEHNHQLPPRKVLKIKSFKIVGIGKVGKGDGSDLFIELRQDNIPIFECNMGTGVNCKVLKFPDSDSIVIEPINCRDVEGDIKVMFKTKNKKIPIGYDKCPFYFWFYTSFIENNQLFLERAELDNPHKPKTHHVFGENFSVTVNFETMLADDE